MGILDSIAGYLQSFGQPQPPPPGTPGSSVASGVTPTPTGAPGAFPPPAYGNQQAYQNQTPQPGTVQQPTSAPAPPPGLPPGTPPLPKPTFLDNPLLQGALSAYFGAIGSPKSRGLGGALSAGGLGGLQGYANARANQLKPYLTAAQLANTAAGTQQKLSQSQLDQIKSQILPGQAQASNALKAAQAQLDQVKASLAPGDSEAKRTAEMAQANLDNANAELDPAKRQQLIASAQNLTAQAGKAGAETAQVAPLAAAKIGEEGAQQKKAETETALAPGLAAATVGEKGATTEHLKAETAAMPQLNATKMALDQARTAQLQAQTISEPGKRASAAALAEKNMRAAYQSQKMIGQDAWNAAAPTLGLPKFGVSYEEFKAQAMKGAGAAGAGAVKPHPALPDGWKQDPNDPNGAWDPSGVHHTYVP